MRYAARGLGRQILAAARGFGSVVVTGPRRAGKTYLLRHLLPKADYVLLEDPDILARVRSDPRGFLAERRPPVILDEIQNAPELFNYVRSLLDHSPRRTGQWFLTGSQEAALMSGVTESLAGRAAIFQLLPLSMAESPKVDLFSGGYPEVIARPRQRDAWFSSYIQSYLERDVRAVTNVRDLSTFRRFLGLVASRHGQVLNRSDLAQPLGVSVPTIGEWLSILEVTGQIFIVPPYFENFGKRLIKSPRCISPTADWPVISSGFGLETNWPGRHFGGRCLKVWWPRRLPKPSSTPGAGKSSTSFGIAPGLKSIFCFPAAGRFGWSRPKRAERFFRAMPGRSGRS